jgi:hypothetical protein
VLLSVYAMGDKYNIMCPATDAELARDSGRSVSTVRHTSFDEARLAAFRLALKHPEQNFFVLKSCGGKIGEPAVVERAFGDDPLEPAAPPPDPEASHDQ